MQVVQYNGSLLDRKRNGSPYDRGGADYYYRRPYRPHYFIGKTYQSMEVFESEMTQEELDEYEAGWNDQQMSGIQK